MLTILKESLAVLHKKKPLVLCLTNYVTMDFTANALLAIKAVPLMSEAYTEIEELIELSQALYINTGTVNPAFMERALFAANQAHDRKIPVILDPVGAGASRIRTESAHILLPYVNIVRGNASEILALAKQPAISRGVETMHQVTDAAAAADTLAKTHNNIIVISGSKDYITNGTEKHTLTFGSPLMTSVTGMGCALTAIIAAFAGSNPDLYQASLHGTAYFGICGELTQLKTSLPGTFKQQFIDTLFQPDWDKMTHE